MVFSVEANKVAWCFVGVSAFSHLGLSDRENQEKTLLVSFAKREKKVIQQKQLCPCDFVCQANGIRYKRGWKEIKIRGGKYEKSRAKHLDNIRRNKRKWGENGLGNEKKTGRAKIQKGQRSGKKVRKGRREGKEKMKRERKIERERQTDRQTVRQTVRLTDKHRMRMKVRREGVVDVNHRNTTGLSE